MNNMIYFYYTYRSRCCMFMQKLVTVKFDKNDLFSV